jgi:hypothetical protein
MNIIGAGMAGLLAGNMLRHLDPTIYEKQNDLPNNHSAILRFRSSVVGDVLGIPFAKVTMVKSAVPWRNSIADAMAYTNKCTGVLRSDRSMPTEPTTEERYIAPPDLINRMAHGLHIKYGTEIAATELKLNASLRGAGPIISTAPMPVMMKLLDYECPAHVHFSSAPGINIRGKIGNCDAYVSLYVPDPTYDFSRVSISGNQMIIEVQNLKMEQIGSLKEENSELNNIVEAALYMLGIEPNRVSDITVTEQRYSKILPIDDDVRKEFLFWATDKFNIYALGRFATWRPKLLLDDLVKDVRLIGGWAARKDRYGAARAR